MRRIALLDPSITSENTGDQIISEASQSVLDQIFPDAFFVRLTTHEFHLWESYRIMNGCDYVFVCGSNLLKSNMLRHNQWKLSPIDFFLRKDCILLGCGWWFYQEPPKGYSAAMLKKILSRTHLHSVRDSYTLQQLSETSIKNVSNTACVTMWGLSASHCAAIPSEKASIALVTVTGYKQDPAADTALINLLLKHYKKVYLWVQQPEDHDYARDITAGRVEFIPPNLKSFTNFLRDNHVDYIGSRLHGGIRALQQGKRTLVLAVDNRATEICRDTGLPVVERTDVASIERWITSPAPTVICLPTAKIDAWRNQFAGKCP